MTEVIFLPPASRFLKKLRDKNLKRLFQEAIERIKEDHTIGEVKIGDLSGVYCYDIYYKESLINGDKSKYDEIFRHSDAEKSGNTWCIATF